MNNRESAGLCRKWARRIRRDSAGPEACERGRLHTRQIRPEGGSLDRYGAYGYAVEAASKINRAPARSGGAPGAVKSPPGAI